MAVLPLWSCGGGGDATGTEDDLSPVAGSWRATVMTMTSQANPEISRDLLAEGASFTLLIETRGRYTATLSFFGQTNVEEGRVSREGGVLHFRPENPPGDPFDATWRFQGETLILDGESRFDLNMDGTTEPTYAHFELVRS